MMLMFREHNIENPIFSFPHRRPNRIFQLILMWLGMRSDLGLIIWSYTLILHSVLKLNSAEAISQALNTCSSHLTHILFFHTVVVIVVVSVVHLAETTATLILVLLNVMCKNFPPSLNLIVYALRMRELRQGLQKVLCWAYKRNKNTKEIKKSSL